MIIIDNKFEMQQMVYLSTDPEQFRRCVIGIKKCADEGVLYELISGVNVSWHYECEMSVEKDEVFKATA